MLAKGKSGYAIERATGVSAYYVKLIAEEQPLVAETPAPFIPPDAPPYANKKSAIMDALRRLPSTIDELALRFDISRGTVLDACDELKADGVNLHVFGDKYSIESAPAPHRNISDDDRYTFHSDGDGYIKFGVTSDNHLCFPAVTPITTNNGAVKIRNIKVGDMVLTHKNRYRSVTKVIKTPHDGTYLTLWFRGIHYGGSNAFASVSATENHPFQVVRNGVEQWLPLREIVAGDAVRCLGHKCRDCSTVIPQWRTVCHEHDPYVAPSKTRAKHAQRREQYYRTNGARHYKEDIVPQMAKWEAAGYRVIPIERVRPDFIAIKDGKVIAVEVESPKNGRPHPVYEKYQWENTAAYYDDVVWLEIDPRTKKQNQDYDWLPANEYGFVGCIVTHVEHTKILRNEAVYNLKVEEDESYVAKRCVVHNCSKYSRLDVVNALYDRFEEAGITQVFNAGNWIDGEARFNKFDLLVHGMNQQVEYFLEHYPQRKGITTSFVAGDDHEGWYCQREGVDIGLYTEMKAVKGGRDDLKYLGYMESYIDLINRKTGNSSKLLVCHPGGGSSYAISYTSQKSVEAYDGGEKPAIALYGHYHKINYSYIRNVHAIQTGCTEDQTPFMRKKKLSAHIGGVIVEAWLDPQGAVTRCRPEFMTFFDRGYHQHQWNMSGDVNQNPIKR